MDKKKHGKFNIIDAIIIVLVVCVGIFVFKTFYDGGLKSAVATEKVNLTFYGEECADYVIKETAVGDSVFDVDQKNTIGTVVDIKTDDSQTYVETVDGKVLLAPKENYSSVYITVEVDGTLNDYGVIVDGNQYVAGHSVVLYAGAGKYYLKTYEMSKAA